jgi:hypothetical protein
MTTVRIEGDGVSVELFHVEERDFPICVIGLELLTGEIKKARKVLRSVGLDPNLVANREAECATLLERFRTHDPIGKLGAPLAWADTLRAGLALEFGRATKLAEDQAELQLDPDDTMARAKQIDRLLSALDVAKMGTDAG